MIDEKEKDKDNDDSTDEAILERARKFLEDAGKAEKENRDRYIESIRFWRLGEQWPKEAIEARGTSRPMLTYNKGPAFIRQLVNEARQNKPGINAIPVGGGADKSTAEVIDGLCRNIEAQSNADIAYDTAIETAASGGFGYIRAKIDYTHQDNFELDIIIEQVSNPLAVYGDFNSKESDSSDWMQCLVMDWMPRDTFKDKYGEDGEVDFDNDFTEAQDWITEDNVAVAEYWEREEVQCKIHLLSNGNVVDDDFIEENGDEMAMAGITVVESKDSHKYEVTQYILSGVKVLVKKEWEGQYIPVFPCYGEEVNENGKRHLFCMTHHAKSAQQSYNYWRTSAVEKVALDAKSPWIAEEGALDNDHNWETAHTSAHPYLTYKKGSNPPFRAPAGGVPSGDLQLAASDSDDMKAIMGIYDASLGNRSNETSGVAINSRKAEGDMSTFHFIDNRNRMIRCMFKCIIDLIPKVYSKARVLRVLKEDGTSSDVKVNEPWLDKGIERLYDLTTGKYDLVLKSGPSFSSRRQESAEMQMQMLQAFPQAAPLVGDLIAKNQDWPDSEEWAKRLKIMLPPQLQEPEDGSAPIPPEVQQQLQQGQEQAQMLQQNLDMAAQSLQQGQQLLQEKEQEIATLKLQLQNKSGELDIKQQEIELKRQELEMKEAESKASIVKMAADVDHREKSGQMKHEMDMQSQMQEDSNDDYE